MSNPENQVVVHITAKAVYVVIGSVFAPDDIRIRGMTHVNIAHNDFIKGKIVNQERLKAAIKLAIENVEDMSKCRVHSIWLSFSTPDILSKNSYGSVKIHDGNIGVSDVVKTLTQAKEKDMPTDHYLMQHVQQAAHLNDTSQAIEDPIGSFADNLTISYHLMMLPVHSRQNIEELFRPLNIRVDYMVFDAVSGSEYSLLEEEREDGVCFIDIGYGSTSFCMYKDNKLVYTGCIPIGGFEVTQDISAEISITMEEAEELKKHYGSVSVNGIDVNQFKTITSVLSNNSEYTVNLHFLAQIIEARYADIFGRIFDELDNKGLIRFIERGIVLSGGGSKIKGMIPFSKKFFGMSVVNATQHTAISAANNFENNRGYDQVSSMIKDSSYFTAIGTLLYSQSEQFRRSDGTSEDALNYGKKTKAWIKKLRNRISTFM